MAKVNKMLLKVVIKGARDSLPLLVNLKLFVGTMIVCKVLLMRPIFLKVIWMLQWVMQISSKLMNSNLMKLSCSIVSVQIMLSCRLVLIVCILKISMMMLVSSCSSSNSSRSSWKVVVV